MWPTNKNTGKTGYVTKMSPNHWGTNSARDHIERRGNLHKNGVPLDPEICADLRQRRAGSGMSWVFLQGSAKQCVPLCSNIHRENGVEKLELCLPVSRRYSTLSGDSVQEEPIISRTIRYVGQTTYHNPPGIILAVHLPAIVFKEHDGLSYTCWLSSGPESSKIRWILETYLNISEITHRKFQNGELTAALVRHGICYPLEVPPFIPVDSKPPSSTTIGQLRSKGHLPVPGGTLASHCGYQLGRTGHCRPCPHHLARSMSSQRNRVGVRW